MVPIARPPRGDPPTRLSSAFLCKADSDSHLPLIFSALAGAAVGLYHLEPTGVSDGFVRPVDSTDDGVLNGSGGATREFDEFIGRVFHGMANKATIWAGPLIWGITLPQTGEPGTPPRQSGRRWFVCLVQAWLRLPTFGIAAAANDALTMVWASSRIRRKWAFPRKLSA